MSFGLTRRQRQVFDFIRAKIEAHNVPPSYDEIKQAVGLKSKSSVARIIDELEERGAIRRLPGRSRSIEIVRQAMTVPSDLVDAIIRASIKTGRSREGVVREVVTLGLAALLR